MSRKAYFKPDIVERGFGFTALPLAVEPGSVAKIDATVCHCLAVFRLDRSSGSKYWLPYGIYRIEDVQKLYESDEDFYEAIESGRLYTRAGPFLLSVEARTMRLLAVDFTTDSAGHPTADAAMNWMHIETPPRSFPAPEPVPDPALYQGGD